MTDEEKQELKKKRLKEAGERANAKNDDKEEAETDADGDVVLPKPKTRISIEFSRSGLM